MHCSTSHDLSCVQILKQFHACVKIVKIDTGFYQTYENKGPFITFCVKGPFPVHLLYQYKLGICACSQWYCAKFHTLWALQVGIDKWQSTFKLDHAFIYCCIFVWYKIIWKFLVQIVKVPTTVFSSVCHVVLQLLVSCCRVDASISILDQICHETLCY